MFATSAVQFLGVVQVRVGETTHTLPVQAISTARDGEGHVGGLFEDDGQLGIMVEASGNPVEIERAVQQAAAEAAQILARRFMH
jgi:hypothetical protein